MFRRTFIIVALSVMPGIYLAAAELKDDRCLKNADIARSIMEMRQKGVSAVDQIKLLRDYFEKPKPFEGFVEVAYRFPIYETESMRSMVVKEFENTVWRACRESMDESKAKNK